MTFTYKRIYLGLRPDKDITIETVTLTENELRNLPCNPNEYSDNSRVFFLNTIMKWNRSLPNVYAYAPISINE